MITNQSLPLRLYLIRHGGTEWSLAGKYSGRADISLTEHGKVEAQKAGERLHGILFAHVLTSPLRRAQQTSARAVLGPTPKVEPDLAEWDNGDDEGLTAAVIFKSRPDWNLFRDSSPRGESPAQISARADRLIAHLRTLNGNVALFSHGYFGRVLAARWIGLSVAQAELFLLSTASISVLCDAHDRADQPAIALWNSVASETLISDTDVDLYANEERVSKPPPIENWENEGGEIPSVPTPQVEATAAKEQ